MPECRTNGREEVFKKLNYDSADVFSSMVQVQEHVGPVYVQVWEGSERGSSVLLARPLYERVLPSLLKYLHTFLEIFAGDFAASPARAGREAVPHETRHGYPSTPNRSQSACKSTSKFI
jgi:hypothetical protein